MSVLSPSGQERIRSIGYDLKNKSRDGSVSDRGNRLDRADEEERAKRMKLLARHAGEDVVEAVVDPRPEQAKELDSQTSWELDEELQAWLEHRTDNEKIG